MKTRTLDDAHEHRLALIFDRGDSVVSTLAAFAKEHNVRAAHFTAIGAFESATLAYFEWEAKRYRDIPVKEQTEVLVLSGDIAWQDDKPVVHAHCVLGKRDGSTVGGHLKEATVRPTLELMLVQAGALRRVPDAASGLALIAP